MLCYDEQLFGMKSDYNGVNGTSGKVCLNIDKAFLKLFLM